MRFIFGFEIFFVTKELHRLGVRGVEVENCHYLPKRTKVVLARATHACRRGAYGIHALQQVTSMRRELAGNGRGLGKGYLGREGAEGHPPPWLRSGRVLQRRVFLPRAFFRGEVCEDQRMHF
jgi:hypothetical protein